MLVLFGFESGFEFLAGESGLRGDSAYLISLGFVVCPTFLGMPYYSSFLLALQLLMQFT